MLYISFLSSRKEYWVIFVFTRPIMDPLYSYNLNPIPQHWVLQRYGTGPNTKSMNTYSIKNVLPFFVFLTLGAGCLNWVVSRAIAAAACWAVKGKKRAPPMLKYSFQVLWGPVKTLGRNRGGKSSVVDPDPELFAGSGSGLNHFGSGSDLYPTFLLKSHIFSIKCTKNRNI